MSVNSEIKVCALPKITFDAQGLRDWANGITNKYKDLVVSEGEISVIKKEMAELNRYKKAVDDARKQAVKEACAPIKAFEEDVKSVVAIFTDTYAFLQKQVKAYEDEERKKKAVEINKIIASEIEKSFGNADDFSIPIQDAWLNKTSKITAIALQIQNIINAEIQSRENKRMVEELKKARLVAIEQCVVAENKKHGGIASVSTFMTPKNMDIATPTEDVLRSIKESIEAQAEAIKARDEDDCRRAEEENAKSYIEPEEKIEPEASSCVHEPIIEPTPNKSPDTILDCAPECPKKRMLLIVEFKEDDEPRFTNLLEELKKFASVSKRQC